MPVTPWSRRWTARASDTPGGLQAAPRLEGRRAHGSTSMSSSAGRRGARQRPAAGNRDPKSAPRNVGECALRRAMAETTPPLPETPAALADRLFPALTPAQLARMAAHGTPAAVREGEVLVDVGDDSTRFFVVVTGRIDIARLADGTEETLVRALGPASSPARSPCCPAAARSSRIRASEAGRGHRARSRSAAGARADRRRAERDPHAGVHPPPGGADRATGSATSCSSARPIAPARFA